MSYVPFCDLSEYNGPVDFVKLKSLYKFVYLRACWGTNEDKFFQEYRAGANAVGLPFGAYAFMDWRYSQSQQLNFFINLMQSDPGQKEPVLDLEMDPTNYGNLTTNESTWKDMMPGTRKSIGSTNKPMKYWWPKAKGYSLSPSSVEANVWNWLTGVEKALSVIPGIYSGYWYWRQWMTPNIAWEKYKLWLAWYSSEGVIKTPPPFTTWDKWQYSPNGSAKPIWKNTSGVGEGKSLDVDWAKPLPAPPQPVPPQPVYPVYKAIYTLNVRSGPSVASALLGLLPINTQISVNPKENTNGYSHFQPNTLFPVGGWIYSEYIKPA